uniref:Uncharacterized protein n=1 Tax=Tetraselmis sp. GSL018 TaxID=582737 RepID=A0A061R9R3_9CHLO|eukprot:CAMPEP_0177591584 /NCGR_PEP_ID=MMETSP0419_2-20121207/8076_1 /TAXON_ID=582737 /ORGANISM="Tetraselmis sp., Strain GSL018" /LENGTH=172 /DNA_ID=CAMNT_0019082337 /DNA_START=167 /DNA_END=685 /DNA_ORIENTATION=+
MKIRAVKMDSSLDKAEVSVESPVKERIAGGLPRTFITFENLSRPYPQGIYSAGNRESKVVRALSSVQSVVSFEAWYKAPALLSNGHASTIAPALLRNAPQVTYERQLLKTPDGGTLGLDFFFPVQEQAARVHSETGVVVIVPGLGGDSSDSYVRSMAANVAKVLLQRSFHFC